jgi:hypothetical protein
MENDTVAIEMLKEKVESFLKTQPGYDPDEAFDLNVFREDTETLAVVYGRDIGVGVVGMGRTAEDAFSSFTADFSYRGFERAKESYIR